MGKYSAASNVYQLGHLFDPETLSHWHELRQEGRIEMILRPLDACVGSDATILCP